MKTLFTIALLFLSVVSNAQQLYQFGFNGCMNLEQRHNNFGYGFFFTTGKQVLFDVSVEQVGLKSYINDYTTPLGGILPYSWHRYLRTDKISSVFSLSVGYRFGSIVPFVGVSTKYTQDFNVYQSPYALGLYGVRASKHPKIDDSVRFGLMFYENRTGSINLRVSYDLDGLASIGLGYTIKK
jgi:hypothetical protein